MTNKVLLVVVLSPIIDVYLMSLLGPSADAMLLSFGTGLVYSVTAGSFVTLIVAEEKEKKNIRTLILTGVHQLDYAISFSKTCCQLAGLQPCHHFDGVSLYRH